MEIILILHNIRSILNVGSIFRSADGFGIKKIYLSGCTPSPNSGLPHVRDKLAKQLHKTALGAEQYVDFESVVVNKPFFEKLRSDGYEIIGLEQDKRATLLSDFSVSKHNKIALILGAEVHGIPIEIRELCDSFIEIPMYGHKESFNVAVAAGIALYGLTTISPPRSPSHKYHRAL